MVLTDLKAESRAPEANRGEVTGERKGVGSPTCADQVQGLVDSSKRRDVDGLSANGTGATNTRGIFARSTVDDGIDEHLEWVLARRTSGEREARASVRSPTSPVSRWMISKVCRTMRTAINFLPLLRP